MTYLLVLSREQHTSIKELYEMDAFEFLKILRVFLKMNRPKPKPQEKPASLDELQVIANQMNRYA